jgi:diguanylate cyclase (GGDEF)-like protein
MLPLFVFSAYSIDQIDQIDQIGQAQKRDDLRELVQRAEAAANATNQRLATSLGYLTSLATSDAALDGDLRALYGHARRVAALDPEVSAFALIAPDNTMAFLTSQPFGAAGLEVGDIDSARQVFASGKPTVSTLFKAPGGATLVTAINVPVLQNGKVAYCLRLMLLAKSLNDVLAAQKLPPDWASSIVDKNGTLLARSHQPELYVGQPATPVALQALKANTQQVFDAVTRDGVAVKSVLRKVPAWDWQVFVGVPQAALNAAPNRALLELVVVGLAFAAAGLVLTLWLAGYITRHIAAVASVSTALHRGQPVKISHTPIRELRDMVDQLSAVTKRERRTTLALMNISTQHKQATGGADRTRLDKLTGLPSRALFLEMVDGLGKAVASGGGVLAFLFINMDGFQVINEAYGREEGDQVLAQVAGILRGLTRESDAAGRLEEDEFIVCLTAPAEHIFATAQNVAARLLAEVKQIGRGVSCSIGVAVWTPDCPDAASAIRHADVAMFEAKGMGKSRYVIYSREAEQENPPLRR